jgi:hypothetical protein
MKYVDIDQTTGEVSWDRYFAYVRELRHRMSDSLYAYASEPEHYSLDGANSLHDAWLAEVQLKSDAPEVVLGFLGAYHDRRHVFRYTRVASYSFDLNVCYTFGDRDVLAHEFRLDEAGLVTHEILFPNERRIIITGADVLPSTRIGT